MLGGRTRRSCGSGESLVEAAWRAASDVTRAATTLDVLTRDAVSGHSGHEDATSIKAGGTPNFNAPGSGGCGCALPGLLKIGVVWVVQQYSGGNTYPV